MYVAGPPCCLQASIRLCYSLQIAKCTSKQRSFLLVILAIFDKVVYTWWRNEIPRYIGITVFLWRYYHRAFLDTAHLYEESSVATGRSADWRQTSLQQSWSYESHRKLCGHANKNFSRVIIWKKSKMLEEQHQFCQVDMTEIASCGDLIDYKKVVIWTVCEFLLLTMRINVVLASWCFLVATVVVVWSCGY